MNVLFVANESKDSDSSIGTLILKRLKELSFTPFVSDDFYPVEGVSRATESNLSEMDFALVLGGDGTILKFQRDYMDYNLPILGINLGRVGALAYAELDNYERYLELIREGKYDIQKRMSLRASVYSVNGRKKKSYIAFNDISISNARPNKLVSLDVLVNEYLSNQFFADGVVISTPSGSSGYNASAGGPLLIPGTKCYLLTPVCPQFTAFSSVVLEEKDVLSVSSNSEKAAITVDGCVDDMLEKGECVVIRKSRHTMKMIAFREPKTLYGTIYKVAMSIYKN